MQNGDEFQYLTSSQVNDLELDQDFASHLMGLSYYSLESILHNISCHLDSEESNLDTFMITQWHDGVNSQKTFQLIQNASEIAFDKSESKIFLKNMMSLIATTLFGLTTRTQNKQALDFILFLTCGKVSHTIKLVLSNDRDINPEDNNQITQVFPAHMTDSINSYISMVKQIHDRTSYEYLHHTTLDLNGVLNSDYLLRDSMDTIQLLDYS